MSATGAGELTGAGAGALAAGAAGVAGSAGAATGSAGVAGAGVSATAGADAAGSTVAGSLAAAVTAGADSTGADSVGTDSVGADSAGWVAAGVAGASLAGAPSLATAFLATFFSGLCSSGCSGRVKPSRWARLVTMSAYASASDDEGPFAATPSVEQRLRTSAFVIPSSFASSWILIFLAATFPIQPFTVVIPSSMRESPGVPVAHRVVASTAFATKFCSYRLFVVGPDTRAPRLGERTAPHCRVETSQFDRARPVAHATRRSFYRWHMMVAEAAS